VGTHVRPQKQVEMGVFDREQVSRVTSLRYVISQRWHKGGVVFDSRLEKSTFPEMWQHSSERGKF
jgi:hypothetical protein